MSKVQNWGNPDGKYLIVGEAPGINELAQGRPFVGASGEILMSAMKRVGIDAGECYFTNACKYNPPRNNIQLLPERLKAEGVAELRELLDKVPYKVGILVGGYATEALHPECVGITAWRGSELPFRNRVHVPTLHPAYLLKDDSQFFTFLMDLKRAKRIAEEPDYTLPERTYLTAPTPEAALDYMQSCSGKHIACDIETAGKHALLCFAIAKSPTDAMCVPVKSKPGEYYYSVEETATLLKAFEDLSKRSHMVWQNWTFDIRMFQHLALINLRMDYDTMIDHHSLFPNTKKNLSYLSSLYCKHHKHWKDERGDWSEFAGNLQRLWDYNCLDACKTIEIHQEQKELLNEFCKDQREISRLMFQAQLRGIRYDTEGAKDLETELKAHKLKQASKLITYGKALDAEVKEKAAAWYDSSAQQKQLFYSDLRIKGVKKKNTKGQWTDSVNDDALEVIARREPLLKPLVQALKEYRRHKTIINRYLKVSLDDDQRMRCSWATDGTKTFRFSSKKTIFNTGNNLQNIPRPDEALGSAIKKLFLPDIGFKIFDADLERADAQVVAWDSGCEDLKNIHKEGADLHTLNAEVLFPKVTPHTRYLAKMGCHAVNYGVKAPTLANALSIPVPEARRFIDTYYTRYPEIPTWHEKIRQELMTKGGLTNPFGYRIQFLTLNVEKILKEAYAWIPQSTIAIVTHKAIINISQQLPQVQTLMQVHDSIVGQYPKDLDLIPQIKSAMEIKIPYSDPLIIPVGIKVSEKSWGDMSAA